jgi:hypothetical protein
MPHRPSRTLPRYDRKLSESRTIDRRASQQRRFRKLHLEALETRELLAAELTIERIEHQDDHGNTQEYYSLRIDKMGDNPRIWTADETSDGLKNPTLHYSDSNGDVTHVYFRNMKSISGESYSGQAALSFSATSYDAVSSSNVRTQLPPGPLYFTSFDGNDGEEIEFQNFSTFGQPLFVLQNHPQLDGIENPPIVIEAAKFTPPDQSDTSWKLSAKNKYFAEPTIGQHPLKVTGIIDTNLVPESYHPDSAGDIGLFSNTTITITGSLHGGDITVATWEHGSILSLQDVETRTPTVTLTGATIDGHDVSITAAKLLRDTPRQVFGFDHIVSKVTITNSTITASDTLDIGADSADTIGFSHSYGYSVSHGINLGLFGLSFLEGNFVKYLPSLRSFLNTVNVMHRTAKAQVTITDSTLTAAKDINISSIATAISNSQSITAMNFGGRNPKDIPKPASKRTKDFFLAATFSHAKSESTLDIKGETKVTSTGGSVNIGSSGKSKASATSRALAGYRGSGDFCSEPEFQAANVGLCTAGVLTTEENARRYKYNSNESTGVLAIAISNGVLSSTTNVDPTSKISAAGNVAILALGNTNVNPTTTSRSYGDGRFGVSISVGVDDSTVKATVAGTVHAGGNVQVSQDEHRITLPDLQGLDLSDLSFIPTIFTPGQEFATGDRVQYMLDPGEVIPGAVVGENSLVEDHIYYVVSAITDSLNSQVQNLELANAPALDLALPTDSQGQPVPISSQQSLEFSLGMGIDSALDPTQAGRQAASVQPGAGYFYSPGYTFTDGQKVHYVYEAPEPDQLTVQNNPQTTPYANWAAGAADHDDRDNLVMNADGTWNDVAGSEKHGYVLYHRGGSYTYVAGPFTFNEAEQDATSQGGYVAFPIDAASNAAIRTAAAGKTVWLNASDNDQEGIWSYWDMSLLDAPIDSLTNNTDYYVIRYDENYFRLAASASDAAATIAIPVPLSSHLQGNVLTWSQFVNFDPNAQDYDPKNDYQIRANGRLTVDGSLLPGVQTGTPVVYHDDIRVSQLLPAPVTLTVQPTARQDFNPTEQTTLDTTVYDSVNSLWQFPSHGLKTGDTLVYHTLSGSNPLQLVNSAGDPVAIPEGTTFYAIVIDSARIRWASSAADAAAHKAVEHTRIDDSGNYTLTTASGHVIAFDPLANVAIPNVDLTLNMIRLEDAQDLVTGQRMTYSAGAGNVAIGGLRDGTDYFVILQGQRFVQLADSYADAIAGVAIDLTNTGTVVPSSSSGAALHSLLAWSVDPVTDWLVVPGHALETGQTVQFQQGAGPAVGLVDGQTYYVVRVDGDMYRLASNLDTALAAGRGTASDSPPAGVINLLSFEMDPASQPIAFVSDKIVQLFDPTLTESTVDVANNSLAVGTGWTLGQEVFYGAGGGTPIGGLTDQTTYYVIPIAGDRIQLAKSRSDANALVAIDLTSTGTLGLSGHYLRIVPEFDLAGEDQPLISFNPLLGPPVNTNTDTFHITGHGYQEGQSVTYLATDGQAIGGLTSGTSYIVHVVDADHFQLKSSATASIIDLQFGATGQRHGFEITRTIRTGDEHLVGLTPGQKYSAVIDRIDSDGTVHLRLASTWLEAMNASLLHYNLSGLDPNTGYGSFVLAHKTPAALTVASQLNASNGATAYPNLGGSPAFWEVLSYPEYAWNGAEKPTPNNNSVFGDASRNLVADEATSQARTTADHNSLSGAFALAEVDHFVTTNIPVGAVLQTPGDMSITATIAQGGTVVSWGSVVANQHTTWGWALGVAIADYHNEARVLIGPTWNSDHNVYQNPTATEHVTLDAGGTMTIDSQVDYDPLANFSQYKTVFGGVFGDVDEDGEKDGFFKGVGRIFKGVFTGGSESYTAAVLSTLGLSSFLNVWVNTTNYSKTNGADDTAKKSIAGAIAETLYKNTSEVTIINANINQDLQYTTANQSVDVDAQTMMTLISLAGMINFDLSVWNLFKRANLPFYGDNSNVLGSAARDAGIGISQILVYTRNKTVAQILGNSILTTGPLGHLHVDAKEEGKRTILAQSGAAAKDPGRSAGGFAGSVALVVGDSDQGASYTLAHIDQSVTVTGHGTTAAAGDLSLTATNYSNTLVGTGAVTSVKGKDASGIGASLGLADLTRNTGAFLGALPSQEEFPNYSGYSTGELVTTKGLLNVKTVAIDSQNLGWTWNVSLVGTLAIGKSPAAAAPQANPANNVADLNVAGAAHQANQPAQRPQVADGGDAPAIDANANDQPGKLKSFRDFFKKKIGGNLETGFKNIKPPSVTRADSAAGTSSTVGISGDLALNVISDRTVAFFTPADFGSVVIAGPAIVLKGITQPALDVESTNATRVVSLAGAGALALNRQDNARGVAIAGSVALNNVTLDTLARIGSTDSTPPVPTLLVGGDVRVVAAAGLKRNDESAPGTVDEQEYFTAISGSVGAANSKGASAWGVALSFASTIFGGTTDAQITAVNVRGTDGDSTGQVTVDARNDLKLSSDGGAFAFSLSRGEGASSVGIGGMMAWNEYTSTVAATIHDASVIASGIRVEASDLSDLKTIALSGAIVVGHPVLAVSGAWTWNDARRDVLATIDGQGTLSVSPDAAHTGLQVTALDDMQLNSFSTGVAVGIGGKSGGGAGSVGASGSHNRLNRRLQGDGKGGVQAVIRDVEVRATGVDVSVVATSTPLLEAYAVPLGVLITGTTVGVNIAAAFAWNHLGGQQSVITAADGTTQHLPSAFVKAEVSPSYLSSADVTVQATYVPDVLAKTVDLALGVTWSDESNVNFTIGFSYTLNHDFTGVSAILGDSENSTSKTIAATGDVRVLASTSITDANNQTTHASWTSHALGIQTDVSVAGSNAVSIGGLGMFAYNVVEPTVTATLENVIVPSATTVSVKAEQTSTLKTHASGFSLGIALAGGTAGVTIDPVIQISVNFDGGNTEAKVANSRITSSGATAVIAIRNPTLEATSKAIQLGLAGAATTAVSVGVVVTTVANNPDRTSANKQDWNKGGVAAIVQSSTITASDIHVLATETPRYHTYINQFDANAGLSGTAAVVISLGYVRSVNRLYDTVNATVTDSTLKATSGVIDVQALLANYNDGDADTEDFNIESFLQSYSFSLAVSYVGFAVDIVGCSSDTNLQAAVNAQVTDSNLSAETGISVVARDESSVKNHWNDLAVAASISLGLGLTLAFPALETNIGNTVLAKIEVTGEQDLQYEVESEHGNVEVLAESNTRALQEVKAVGVAVGIVALALSAPKLRTKFYSSMEAVVRGTEQADSLRIRAYDGDVTVRSRYLGKGPNALQSTIDDVNVAIGIGFAVDLIHADIDATPEITTSVAGGVQIEASRNIAVEATSDGRLLTDTNQWDLGLIDANVKAHVGTVAKPALSVLVGAAASASIQWREIDEAQNVNESCDAQTIQYKNKHCTPFFTTTITEAPGAVLLSAPSISLTSKSTLDAATKVKQASFAVIIATAYGEANAIVEPTIQVRLTETVSLQASQSITIDSIGGVNTNPPPSNFNTEDVDLTYNTIDFGKFDYLNDNDRMKYEVGDGNTTIVGLDNDTVYHVFPVNESTIQLGEEFDARTIQVNQNRLLFSGATAFRGPFSLADWNPSNWSQVVYQVPAGTAVGGLTVGKTYLVNKISDSVVMLVDPDHQPSAPKPIDNSSFSTDMSVGTAGQTTFHVDKHGFSDGQLVSYVAPTPLRIDSSSVNTKIMYDGVNDNQLILKSESDAKDHAIFVGPQISLLQDGATVTYHVGDSKGNWFWNDAPADNVVGAQGQFWDSNSNSAPDQVYTNWATNEPSTSAAAGGYLQMNSDGTWSNPIQNTTLRHYVMEQPEFEVITAARMGLNEKNLDWSKVHDWASKNGYWLPSITSSVELNAFTKFMQQQNISLTWLGGTDAKTPDTWSWDTSDLDPDNGQKFWLGRADGNNQEDFALPWATNEPNDGSKKNDDDNDKKKKKDKKDNQSDSHLLNRENRLIATMNQGSLTWNDHNNNGRDVGTMSRIILERPRYVLIQLGDSVDGTAASALRDIRTYYSDAWLATIGSEANNEAIQKLLQDHNVSAAWLGGVVQGGIKELADGAQYKVRVLSDAAEKNFGTSFFTKSNNTSSTPYANWAPNSTDHDDKDYLVMKSDGTWTDVLASETHGYVLYKTGSPFSYVSGSFTFAQAVVDATERGGFVAFPRNSSDNTSIKSAAGGNIVWLNASDSAHEGTWRYWDITKSGHALSIQLLDPITNAVIQVSSPTTSFAFTLNEVDATPIDGLIDGKTYVVQKVDLDHFRLQIKADDDSLTPVVLPTPSTSSGGRGNFLGTLGVDLTSTGTGQQRLIFDLQNKPTTNQTQHLLFQTAGSTSKSAGTGTATAISSGHVGAAIPFAKIHSNSYAKPQATITIDPGSQLQSTGSMTISATAYGNGVSTAYARTIGVVNETRADAELELGQQATIDVQGSLKAADLAIKSNVNGNAVNLSQAIYGALVGGSRADARIRESFASQVTVGPLTSPAAGTAPTELLADTKLTVTATMGIVANLLTNAQGGLLGRAVSNWGDDDTDIIAISMMPDEQHDNTARVTIGKALLEVKDLNGVLKLDASIAGVDATAMVKAHATGLNVNRANAKIEGDLDARVRLLDGAELTAATIALAARETLHNWQATAEINKNGNQAEAISKVTNMGDVQIQADDGAILRTRQLTVDARQLQRIKPDGTWEPDPYSLLLANSYALKPKEKNADRLQAYVIAKLNDAELASPTKTIDWNASLRGFGLADLTIPATGAIPANSPVQATLGPAAHTITIADVNQLTPQIRADFNWTISSDLTGKTATQKERLSNASGATYSSRSTGTPAIATVSNPTVTANLIPIVKVENYSDNDLALKDLHLSSLNPSSTGPFVYYNGNQAATQPSLTVSSADARITINNEAPGRDIRLEGAQAAYALQLNAERDVVSAQSYTLNANRFILNAGRTLGQASATFPADPRITLQSTGLNAQVQAAAGQDLMLQVRFEPEPNHSVVVPSQFTGQQLDVRLLPWITSGSEVETNYHLQVKALSSTVVDRVVSVLGNMRPMADWTDAQTLSPTLVGINVSAAISNQPNPPRMLVAATSDVSLNLAAAGGGASRVTRVNSVSGDVLLDAGGDLTIDSLVSAAGTVTWSGTGALRGAPAKSPVVQADKLIIAGAGGLGDSAFPLATQVTWLQGMNDRSSGEIRVQNTDTGTGLGLQLQDLAVDTGALLVITSGMMTVSGPVANYGGGNLSLVANGKAAAYQYVPGSLTFTQAQADAAARGGTLASVTSPVVNQLFTQLAGSQSQPVWLGGNNQVDRQNYQWTLPDGTPSNFYHLPGSTAITAAPIQVTVSPISFWRNNQVLSGRYANWATGEPSNSVTSRGSENHGEMRPDGFWNDLNRERLRYYVLYVPETGSYTLVNDRPRTFTDALLDARDRGGYVARVTNASENAAVKNAANGNGVWLNMSDEGHEGDWQYAGVPSRFAWSNWQPSQPQDQLLSFTNWKTGEPNNANGNENYAVLDDSFLFGNGRWNDVSGTSTYGYVLYKPQENSYTYQSGEFTFDQAVLDAAIKGGFIAHITNPSEQSAVRDAASGHRVWINATDEGSEGIWRTGNYVTPSSSATLGYQNVGWSDWAVGEPNDYNGIEDHAVMLADGTWNDVNENNKYGYVLKKQDGSFNYIPGPFTFSQAKADAVIRRGYVAPVATYADQQKIRTVASGNTVWINNTDSQVEGQWLAYDYTVGGYRIYSNWNSGEPNNTSGNENYAIMRSDGRWNDTSGTSTYGYVLYLPATGAYSYQSTLLTYAQAVFDAAKRGGYVAHITNGSEQNAVKTAASGNMVWINATDDGTEGNWRAGTYGSQLNAAILQIDGTFTEVSADTKTEYVLYEPQSDRYSLIHGQFTFAQALADAQSRGGEVARITTRAHYDQLRQLNQGSIWINLSDGDSEGTWRVNTSVVNPIATNAYTNWDVGQPSNLAQLDYMIMGGAGKWSTTTAAGTGVPSKPQAYVLYRPADHSYTLIPGSFTFEQAHVDAFQRGGFVAKISTATEQTVVQTAAAGNTIWLNGWNDGNGAWRMLTDYPAALNTASFMNWAENFGLSSPRDWANGRPRGMMRQSNGSWTLRDLNTSGGYLLQQSEASIFVNAAIEAAGGDGNINLIGLGDICLGVVQDGSGAVVSTGTIASAGIGQIAVGPGTRYVNQLLDGDGTANLKMQSGTQITSESGTIALLATGSVTLSQLVTGGRALVVADYNGVQGKLHDGSGTITSAVSSSTINVTADEAIFAAEGIAGGSGIGSGIGSRATPIQTDVNVIAATTDKGDLAIENHGDLVLGSVDVQLSGLLATVLKWKDVAPVTKLPAWMSEWFRQRQAEAPLIATADGHFVMGGVAILDQDNAGKGTANVSIIARDGNLVIEDEVPVVNLDAGELKLAAFSSSLPEILALPSTTRLYTEGGTGKVLLQQGNPAYPQTVAVPSATCNLYRQLDVEGELTAGQEAWLNVSGCPSGQAPRMSSVLRSGPVLMSAAADPAPLMLSVAPSTINYFVSPDRAARDSATQDQATESSRIPIDTSHVGEQIMFVRVFSPDGEWNDFQRTINIRSVNQAPTDISLTSYQVEENSAGAIVGELTISDTDADQSHTFDLSDSRFQVIDGTLRLQPGIRLNFETEPLVTMVITATDSGIPPRSYSQTVMLGVMDQNDTPVSVSASSSQIRERLSGIVVGTLGAGDADADQEHVYLTSDPRFEITGNTLKLLPDQYLSIQSGTVSVDVTVVDSGTPRQFTTQTLTFQIDANPLPFHHTESPLDVDDDGLVVPLDALLLVNLVNRPTLLDAYGRLPEARSMDNLPFYFDVNGDNHVTPMDILQLINHLNTPPASTGEPIGNGESEVRERFVSAAAGAISRAGAAEDRAGEGEFSVAREAGMFEPIQANPAADPARAVTSHEWNNALPIQESARSTDACFATCDASSEHSFWWESSNSSAPFKRPRR